MGEIGLLGSPARGGAGLNGWATGLVVCPAFNLGVLNDVEAGRGELVVAGLGLLVGSVVGGFGVLGRSGLCPLSRVDSGRGLGWGLGARMGLIVAFLSTVKGFGVRRGFGLGVGLLGSGLMRRDWVREDTSSRFLLLESVRGLRCRRPPDLPTSADWTSTSAAIMCLLAD